MNAAWLGLCGLLAGCLAGAGRENARREPPSLARRWHYEVRLNAELTSMDATVCFEGAVPAELRAGRNEAATSLRYARWASPLPKRRLLVERGRILLDRDARDACVEYGVELNESRDLGRVVHRTGRDLLASPNVWLWRPDRRSVDASATLRLSLPNQVHAALPWPQRDGRYQLGPAAFTYDAHAAFGGFGRVAGSQGHMSFDAAVLEGPLRVDLDGVTRWLRSALEVAQQGPQHAPLSALHVLVMPVGESVDPVPFGTVTRGGSGSILLFVSSSANEAELRSDWVLPHELSHLFVPFVGREHAWFSEGLASYYQEVLRGRAGVVSEERAFTNLVRAMRSAMQAGTGRLLAEESRDMHQTYAFRAVYWAGAAYFLMADTELRRRSKNQLSLDDVLDALGETPAPANGFTLTSLLQRLDALAGANVFTSLAEQCLLRSFPDVEPVLLELGAPPPEGVAVNLDTAPLASVRHAIFSPQPRK